ncbi:MAG TPA: N-acetylmuramidase domain-containing protein [Casimicrobiaceae bacterium]
MADFSATALPLDLDGIQTSLDVLQARAADLWAVIGVETSGCGFLPDRRVKILYERHVFSRLTHRRFDAKYPSISNPTPGGYGAGGAPQYDRLALAIARNRKAALQSCSWGVGQVMGYNAEHVGFADVEDMVARMGDSENTQLEAMARFITANGLDGALRTHDWPRFAAGYNGPNYRINNYDTRLAAVHAQLSRGTLPDLRVRAAQVFLTFLDYDPHGVDGVMGRLTRAAMNDYQADKAMPLTDFVDDATFGALREDCRIP